MGSAWKQQYQIHGHFLLSRVLTQDLKSDRLIQRNCISVLGYLFSPDTFRLCFLSRGHKTVLIKPRATGWLGLLAWRTLTHILPSCRSGPPGRAAEVAHCLSLHKLQLDQHPLALCTVTGQLHQAFGTRTGSEGLELATAPKRSPSLGVEAPAGLKLTRRCCALHVGGADCWIRLLHTTTGLHPRFLRELGNLARV